METAAIYARYSSDKQREASIEDQQRNCERIIKANGWKCVECYSDEAISGSRSDRPEYQRMIQDAERKKFDVLVVDDLSRLSRDDVEMKQVIKRFKFWGLRIVSASDGFDTDQKGYKIQAGFRGLMNEMYLDDLREKTHRGLTGQALKGNSCGGKCYGYKPLPIYHPTETDEFGRPTIVEIKKQIDPEEAKWINWIFNHYADGYSPRKIASELNRMGVPSSRGKTWAASAIHGSPEEGTGVLNNPLYIGKFVWNRREWVKNPDTGRRTYIPRPPSEWITTNMPELQIIDDVLWQRVKDRQSSRRSEAIRVAKAGAGRPGAAKYLLSSLLTCGCCGGNYIMVDYYRYGCAVHKDRGATACSNDRKVKRTDIERIILQCLEQDLFTEECIALFKKEVQKILREQAANKPNKGKIQKDIAINETAITNLMKAIKAGIFTESTKSELESLEREKAKLHDTLGSIDGKVINLETALPAMLDRYKAFVVDLGKIPERQIPKARTHIKELIGGTVSLHPTYDGLEAELAGSFAGLMKVTSSKSKKELVAGVGFEPTTFRL